MNRHHFDTTQRRVEFGKATRRWPMSAPAFCVHERRTWLLVAFVAVNRVLILRLRGCSIHVQRVESLSTFTGSTRTHEAPLALTSTWYVYVQRRFPFRKSYRSTGIQGYKYV